MSESASDAKIRELSRQLKNEKTAHSVTRNELKREVERVWRLVPTHYITLMGVYPPLRKLLHVLAEAADLQDPSRGAPVEDTMRTQFVPDGENASTSSTERGVLTHARVRAHVRMFNKELEAKAHYWAQTIGASEWEYQPPDGRCEECGNHLVQTSTGRRRQYCSDTCRQRASRNVTKPEHAESLGSR